MFEGRAQGQGKRPLPRSPTGVGDLRTPLGAQGHPGDALRLPLTVSPRTHFSSMTLSGYMWDPRSHSRTPTGVALPFVPRPGHRGCPWPAPLPPRPLKRPACCNDPVGVAQGAAMQVTAYAGWAHLLLSQLQQNQRKGPVVLVNSCGKSGG
jgi:hypothetical protein